MPCSARHTAQFYHRRTSSSVALQNQKRFKNCYESEGQAKVNLQTKHIFGNILGLTGLIRLNVLRAILSDATNASKGPSPIKTDLQVLALLRKRIAGSKAASEEFMQAKRDDLKLKQDEEIAVMDEYAGQVETVAEEDIAKAVEQAYETLKNMAKVNAGMMLKELLRPGGMLNGKAVDGSQVARIVHEILQTKT